MKTKLFTLLLIITLITSSKAANYYWIGGSGGWGDINHWATTTGGSILQSVIPSANDDVFFDANSGFTAVSKNVGMNISGNCRNMTWVGTSNNPVVSLGFGGTSALNISGSLLLQNGITFLATSNFITFNSSSPNQTIQTNGVNLNCSINFNSLSGSWILQDDLTAQDLSLTNGSINTNSVTLNLSNFTGAATSSSLTLGASILNISGNFSYLGNILSAGTSSINLTGVYDFSQINFNTLNGHTYNNVFFTSPLSKHGVFNGGSSFLKINTLSIAGSCAINGAANFDKLILASGKKYSFASTKTQTISTILTATANICNGLTDISASNPDVQAVIQCNAGASISLNGILFSGIKFTGPSIPVTSSNSYDNGNNTNINFTAIPTKILYWIGGAGNWNDNTHWALSSGGSSSACLPTPNDNVMFDANSGFIVGSAQVSINDANQYCNNMTWSGALSTPTISGDSRNYLNIFGSITLQPSMVYSVQGTWLRSNVAGNTITTNNNQLQSEISVFGDGSWIFQDDYNSTGSLFFLKGTLNTNNKRIDLYSLTVSSPLYSYIGSSGIRNLTLGSSQLYIGNTWYYFGFGNTLNSGTSHIRLTGIDNFVSFEPNNSDTYYDVSFTNPSCAVNRFRIGVSTSNVNYRNVVFLGNADIKFTNSISNLTLSAGKKYLIDASAPQRILSSLTATAALCTGAIEIQSIVAGSQASFSFATSSTSNLNNLVIKDIKFLGFGIPVNAVKSVDLGNNTNVNFTTAPGTNLYWIGGNGLWNDGSHWSYTSGGGSAFCVPGPSDNVFFDSGSGFSVANNTVTLDGTSQFCNNMTWSGASSNPFIMGIDANSLSIFGSLTLQTAMSFDISRIYFRSAALNNMIIPNGNNIINSPFGSNSTYSGWYFTGTGTWNLMGDLNMPRRNIYFLNGSLNTNNNTVNLVSFTDYDPSTFPTCPITTRTLSIGSSTINIALYWSYIGVNSVLNSSVGSSLSFGRNAFSSGNSSFTGQNGHTYFNLIHNPLNSSNNISINASSCITTSNVNFNKIELWRNASINGALKMDTLIFNGGGNNYTLESGKTQTVTSAFYPNGNPCAVTFIKSSIAGTRANLNILSGNVNYDYVNMKDIDATSSYLPIQLAGHSTNAGNNLNMVFAPTTTVGITGLGPDITLCQSALPLTLNTFSFFPNPVTTFLWTGGAKTNSLSVTLGGTYSVAVKYSAACTVTDNITITTNPTPTITASGTSICGGGSATLTALGAATYTWVSPSATTNTVVVSPSTSTVYTIIGTSAAGCTTTLTNIPVTVNPTPTVSIASITNGGVICNGNVVTITPSGASTYTLVNTGVSGTSFTVNPVANTTYSIIGITAGCISNNAITTITVNANPTVAVSSVSNPTICSGNSSTITPSGASTFTLTSSTTTLTSSPFVVNPISNTTYTIVGTSAANCASSNNVTSLIIVNTTPTVVITSVSNSTICSGNTSTITSSGASTYTLVSNSTTLTTNPFIVSPSTNTTYTLIGSTAASCKSSNNPTTLITVNATPTIGLASISSTAICSGQTVTITPNGAMAGSYTLTPGNIVGTSFTVFPTSTTNYTLNGANANGCISTTSSDLNVSLTVNATPTVAAIFSSNAICSSQNVTITLSGANSGYTLNPGNTPISSTTSSIVISPPAGTTIYTITANNTNGCLSTLSNQIYTTSVSVVTNPTITVSAITSSICAGATASITPFGATTFTLIPGNIAISSGQVFTINPTIAITYTINGTATGGCMSIPSTQFVTTIGINQNPTITAVSALGNALCSGLSTTLTASGANSYVWASGPNTPDYIVSPSATKIYTVIGTDINGCSNSATPTTLTVNILSSPSLALATSISSNTLCSGNSATIALAGADPGVTYTLIPSNLTSTLSFVVSPTVTQGYTVIATNFNGCTTSLASQQYTTSVTVAASPTITLVSALPSNSICSGQSVTITPSGGVVGSYTLINNPSATEPFVVSPNLTTTYTIAGTGSNGCISTSSSDLQTVIAVNQSPIVTATSVLSNTICSGITTTLSASGATSYTWSGGPNSADYVVSPTATAIYTVTGTDINGCSNNDAPTSFTLVVANSLSVIVANTLPASCGLSNGSVTLITTGGSPVYTYSWVPVSASSYTTLASTNGSLSIGTTTLYVIDGNGCITNTTINITNPNAPVLTSTVTNIICYGASTGVITTDVVSSSACTYTWSNNTYSADLSGVVAGVYTVTIQDGSLCSSTQIISITQPSVAMSLQITNLINACQNQSNGSTTVTVIGGTPQYAYTWLPIINNTNVLSNIPVGNYTVQATDINGCNTTTIVTISTSTNPVIVSINNITPATCNQNNGSITIDVTGGLPLYSYQWLPTNNASQNLENILAGNYTVIVIDNTGCRDSLTLTLDCKVAIFIPTLFSPNGDGKNDLFEIKGTENYPNNNISIFNRWGNLIYSKKKYDNTFDGKANVSNSIGNGLLPSGTYFVVFDFGDETAPPYKGYLELKY